MWNDPEVAKAISKMQPDHLQDELRSEIFLVICEMNEDRLKEYWHEGYKRKDCGEKLKHYIVRTMLNMAKSDRSTFYNKFRRSFEEWNERMDVKDEADQIEVREEMAKRLKDNMNSLHWYEQKLIEIWAENGRNMIKISRDTGIPYRSLSKTIIKAKKELRIKIRRHGKG